MKSYVFLIDLDGVLADWSHRLPLIQQEPEDRESFYAAMPNDPATMIRSLPNVLSVSILVYFDMAHRLAFAAAVAEYEHEPDPVVRVGCDVVKCRATDIPGVDNDGLGR